MRAFWRWLRVMLLKLGIMVASICVALVFVEGVLFLSFDRINLQMGTPVVDSKLVLKLEPYSAGHDEWGMRNSRVPGSVPIVAIGDSQTYGVAARAKYSWPAQLARMLGTDVYNMGLGSYGPHQYQVLLEDRALGLAPDIIIVGLYFGNDLHNASIYHRVVERIRRDPEWVPWTTSVRKSIRDFLSEYSTVYKLIANVGVVNAQLILSKYGIYEFPDEFTELLDEDDGIRTFLTPKKRLIALDRDDGKVERGFGEAMSVLGEMGAVCREQDIELLVLLIPTKETVYRRYVEKHRHALANVDLLEKLLADEEFYFHRSAAALMAFDIDHIDLRQAMSDQLSSQSLYPSHDDGHPNRHGYEVIAREVSRYVNDAYLSGSPGAR